MTARSDLSRAQRLSAELDDVNQALAIVAAGGFSQRLELTIPDKGGVTVTLGISAQNLTTMLTNRKTAIETALTGLGVT